MSEPQIDPAVLTARVYADTLDGEVIVRTTAVNGLVNKFSIHTYKSDKEQATYIEPYIEHDGQKVYSYPGSYPVISDPAKELPNWLEFMELHGISAALFPDVAACVRERLKPWLS